MTGSRDEFTSVPLRMTLGLLSGAAAAVVTGVTLLAENTAGGTAMIAASAGPLYILWHARRRARASSDSTTPPR
jgi:hypothetical protein